MYANPSLTEGYNLPREGSHQVIPDEDGSYHGNPAHPGQAGVYSPLGSSLALARADESKPKPPVSKIPLSTLYDTEHYKYIVMPGNNSKIIKEIMEKRDWWIECPPFNTVFNLKWSPVSHGIKFDRLHQSGNVK